MMLCVRTVAIDIDLHRVHAWMDGAPAQAFANYPPGAAITALRQWRPERVLIEIASPVRYQTHQHQHKREEWALFNVYTATVLAHELAPVEVLVAPSSAWSRGFSEEVRHKLAGVEWGPEHRALTKKHKHDLGECRAMLWFYEHHPDAWVGIHDVFSGAPPARERPVRLPLP